jgi:RNA polymerase sigma-70 factor (ECF subfamily)
MELLKKRGVKWSGSGIIICETCYLGKKMDKNINTSHDDEKSKRFVSLFIPAQKKLYAYINYHAPNKNDSDDIFQEVAATLLSKFADYKDGTDFLRWAITVAKYKILSFRRNNKRMRILFDEDDMDRFENEALSRIDLLDEESELLKKCLGKLPDKQRKLLSFRYSHDMTYRQIAKEFNVSMQSIYKAVARVHAALLKCMKFSSETA